MVPSSSGRVLSRLPQFPRRQMLVKSGSMAKSASSMWAYPVATGLVVVVFAAWTGWKSFQDRRADQAGSERDRRLRLADSAYPAPIDSFCRRIPPHDTLLHEDGFSWFARNHGLPLRRRGHDEGWEWACLGTADSGIVVFLALDTGCVRGGEGGLWNHSCRVQRQTLDLVHGKFSPSQGGSHQRSLWTFPGESRLCVPGPPSEPPVDSLALERCAR